MKLASLFRRAKVDLLHLNNTGAEPAPIAARFAGCRHIVGTWHVDSTYDLDNLRGGLRYRVLEELSMRSLHRSIAVSMATKSDWLKRCRMEAYANRVTVIHNGIDPARVARMRTVEERRRELGIPADATVIGSLGRLDRAKGYEYLLQAMALFLRQLNNTHVVIGGSGPLVGSLTDLANELGISKRVHFLGHVADPRMVLNALDIYVQPSLCEAFPIALLEASAAGLPVVASDVGGIPESVLDGETGFVVPPKDPGSLAGSIEKLLADPQLRRAMGDAGVARTRREFSLDTMVRQTLEVYGSLLHMPELPATRIPATPPVGGAPPAPGGEPSLMVSGGVSR
jgi:glycosyltransferase involved in cell wall biosynthesis